MQLFCDLFYNSGWFKAHVKSHFGGQGTKQNDFLMHYAVLIAILATDDLRERRQMLVNWCCWCRKDGEDVDHVLIHCSFATYLWSLIIVCLSNIVWEFLVRIGSVNKLENTKDGQYEGLLRVAPTESIVESQELLFISFISFALKWYSTLYRWMKLLIKKSYIDGWSFGFVVKPYFCMLQCHLFIKSLSY